jgi:hypothetical protein
VQLQLFPVEWQPDHRVQQKASNKETEDLVPTGNKQSKYWHSMIKLGKSGTNPNYGVSNNKSQSPGLVQQLHYGCNQTGAIGDVRKPGEVPSRDGTTVVYRSGFPYSSSTLHADGFFMTLWWMKHTRNSNPKLCHFVGPLHL